MSWLTSLILAGAALVSANGDGALQTVYFNYENTDANAVVRAADETERFEQTYPLSATGRVDVSNINGSITVDVWDSAQVKLEYVKTADSRERLADVEVKIDARQDSFRVETDFENAKRDGNKRWRNGGKMQIEYRLTVPRTAVLDQIATVNGSVNVRDAANVTKASAVNGEVVATNLRGTAHLSTVNGIVRADFDRLQTGAKITLETVNGAAELTVPSDLNATVKAETLNGQITNDFGLPVRKGQFVGRDLYGRLGSGEAVQIRLNSVNGALSIRRRNDGKTVNPATNLLSNKSFEDIDERDENNQPRVKPPRPPRPPRPPAAPPAPEIDNEAIRKSVEEAMKEARAEIRRIQPDLAKITREGLEQAAVVMNSLEIREQIRAAQAAAAANFGALRIEEKGESFTVKGTPKITVEAGNCDVTVRGWDKPEVSYAATRVSKNQSPLDLMATRNGSDVNIKIGGGGAKENREDDYFFGEMNRSRIEIFVPKKSDLKIVTGGEIRLENVSGALDLRGDDESINVRDAGGRLSVGNADGVIRVIGFRGAFDGRTDDGTMNLEGDFESLDARAADGTIILTLPDDANAVLEANRQIENEFGANLIRRNTRENLWRVGAGGDKVYRMSVADGKVVVRSASALKTY